MDRDTELDENELIARVARRDAIKYALDTCRISSNTIASSLGLESVEIVLRMAKKYEEYINGIQ